ncbi:DUF4959 domain-containing protein [Treponema vincentii]|uniref:fibronectin type III domain-containing protein n=1 Tax=Treponema vincentii TaxID=69710 RepID=UPI0020A37204|nr:fibronectin type III domain-containing protein [Treponema vincentii]UTC45334.1 DUF4959 domain-containing protein [Treponema vincentii]
MKKNIRYITIVAACMAVAAMIIGCKSNITPAQDTTAPAEVTALNAVTGDGKVSLSWKNPGDADLYQVEISASPAAGTLSHAVYLSAKKSENMSFTAEGLSNGTAYTFTVKTLDKSLNKSTGVSTAEAVKPVDTSDKTPPAEVTELNAVTGDGKISLSWKNPGDADLYQVEISASPAAGTLSHAVYLSAEKGKTMSFTAEGLTNGTAYTFTVKTLDKALNKSTGVSTAEAVKPVDTSDKTPPADVTNLNAVPTGNSKISVSWTNPVDADLHQVEITVQKEGETGVSTMYISAEKGKDSGYVIEGLAANTTYTVTVKTIDKALNKSKDGVSKTVTTKTAGSVMTIILTQNPEKTVWTKDSVTITAASSTSIKKAKWKEGSGHSAKDVLESGNLLVGNSFTVTQNGIYSVVVQDNDGRREVETIEIKNIDKTPPPAPKNFTAQYTLSAKKIVLNWADPVDTASGLKELKLSYTVNGANEKTETITKGVQTFEIENVEPQSPPESYAFSLKAVDNVGNEGTAASLTITPSPQAEVTGISLNNRTHLDTIMANRDIPVTITGSNFDKLTSLLVQVTDGSTNYPAVTAAIDAPNNKATATVQAPVPSYPTDEGTTYTVKAIVNSATPAAATASFIVSNPAQVRNIELKPAQLKLGSATKVSVAVTGTNFDIRGETKIKLLDSNEAEVTASTKIVPAGEGTATEFSAEIPLPTESGVYTVAVYFDEVKESKTSTLQLYGAPEITSISIPKAGTGYGGNKLPVTIKGKNFTAPGAIFSGSGASITNFTVVNDTTATAEVTCPYSAGEHTVTVMCGTESSKTGTISVKGYTGYEVGKIVLANNTLVDKAGYTIDSSNPPVAIICGTNGYGAALGIALHTGSSLVWAKDGSTGYNTKFEGIICTPSQRGIGAAQTATFTGDSDGSDNWEYIKQQDPAGAADAATNYPAFHWVNTYNTTYAAKLGSARPSWYMPSLAELCEVYKNREAINASLAKIHGLNNAYADSNLDTSWYWSSSQRSLTNDVAWGVDFGDGNVGIGNKNYDARVCCLSGF